MIPSDAQDILSWRRRGEALVGAIDGLHRPFAFIERSGSGYVIRFPTVPGGRYRGTNGSYIRLKRWAEALALRHGRQAVHSALGGREVIWQGGDKATAFLSGFDRPVATITIRKRGGHVLEFLVSGATPEPVWHTSRYRLASWAERYVAHRLARFIELLEPASPGAISDSERWYYDSIWKNYIPASRRHRH